MELWIRSQDRKSLVKVDSNLTVDDTNSIFCDYDSHFIGSYKTKERALEVLDYIEDHVGFLNVEMGAGRFGELDFQTDIVYQMPKE